MLQAQVYDLREAFHAELHEIHSRLDSPENRQLAKDLEKRFHDNLINLVNGAVSPVDQHYK